MKDRANEGTKTGTTHSAPVVRGCIFQFWPIIAALTLSLAAVAVVAPLAAGPRNDELLIFTIVVAAAILTLRLLSHNSAPVVTVPPLYEIFDSVGVGVVTVDLDGRLSYANSTAERLLGCHAEDLMKEWATTEVLAPGEGVRLVAEMEKICGLENPPAATAAGRMAAYLNCVRILPPSRVPSFEVQLRRKDGALIPITLHISALRDGEGAVTGLVAVAVDQTSTQHQEQALRESQERYRDLFENSNEMIATLSPAGKFLYANPAWKRCFGLDTAAILSLDSIEELFGPATRVEMAALIRRAVDGEQVDRVPLRHHTLDGRVLELELTLGRRQKTDNPLAVRCLLRDVTQHKQREHRLALQLLVSQIVGENNSPEVAAARILEALCVSQGWDVAVKWDVDAEEKRLEFSTAWGSPGRNSETLIQESMGLTLERGIGLPGRAWSGGRAVWIADLVSQPPGSRTRSALRQQMVSGWAVPVRVGSKVLAVLEFYCHFRLREDPEVMASLETAAASLGQMLARSHERGRAEELYRQQEILLDSVADGICGVDRRGLVSFVNPAAARMLGAVASDIIGKPVHDLLHGAAAPGRQCKPDCLLRHASTNHKTAAGEDTIFRSDGSAFPAEYVLTPILDQGPCFRFRAQFSRYQPALLLSIALKTSSSPPSVTSCAPRSPPSAARWACSPPAFWARSTTRPLTFSASLSPTLTAWSASSTTFSTWNASRAASEPLAFRPVQLAEIVRQAIDGMQPVAEAAGVQLIHDTTKVEIEADPDRLLQVLTNLLSNAVKFSPPNSTISVMLRPGVSGVTLSVIDQGRGIPADKLDAIFGRFQQVEASDSRQNGRHRPGTCHLPHHRPAALRAHLGGTESRPRLHLPRLPALQTGPHALPDSPSAIFDQEPGHGTVLLADADETTRPLIAAKFTRHGYRVVETATMEQTLVAAHSRRRGYPSRYLPRRHERLGDSAHAAPSGPRIAHPHRPAQR